MLCARSTALIDKTIPSRLGVGLGGGWQSECARRGFGGSDEGPGEAGGLSCRAPCGHHMAPHGITGTALHHRCHTAARGWVLDKMCNKGGKKKKAPETVGGGGSSRDSVCGGGSSRDSLLNLSALHYRWKIQRKKKRKKKSVAELFKTLKPVLFK